MSKQCDSNQCDSSCGDECCRSSCGSTPECPVECATEKWKDSFCQAMTAAQVEILKEKILKAHRPMMEQAADAFLEAAMACWQSQIAEVQKHQAAEAFKGKLVELWTQSKKK